MTTTIPPLPPTHESASTLHLSSADFYFAVGTAVSCWNVSAKPDPSDACAPLGAQCLETAIAGGVSHLLGLLNGNPAPPRLPLTEIIASVALEAGIGHSMAAALFVRVFADVLSVPTVNAAFGGLPLAVQRSWAADWAHLAHAAWRANWYPELVSRPVYAAGVLSGGWPCLFVAAAWVFDTAPIPAGQAAPDASAEMTVPTSPLLDSPTTVRLPERLDALKIPSTLVSDPMAYLRRFQALNDATPIPDALKQAVEEFMVTVIHHWLSTGDTPVAAWVSIPAQSPNQNVRSSDQVVTVFDHKPQASQRTRPAKVNPATVAPPLLQEGRPIANALSV